MLIDEQAVSELDAAQLREVTQRLVGELRHPGKRERLMEQLTIGGLTFSELIASRRVPEEIAAAYAAADPVESGLLDFRDKVDSHSSGDELEGLVNGLKGKWFEMQYVDELNVGGLPDGWHAMLATRATQPGGISRSSTDTASSRTCSAPKQLSM